MKQLIIYLKGILLGFVSIAIPGLSASTIALIVNIYYEMINSISDILKTPKKSIKFLVFLMLGYGTGAFLGAVSINFAYQIYPLPVILIIMGFIIGAIPGMIKDLVPYMKKASNWIVLGVVTTLLLVYSYIVTNGDNITFENMQFHDYISLAIIGLLTSATLVIPGIDFAVVFLSLGYYYAFIDLLADLPNLAHLAQNLLILGVYLTGYVVGSFLFSKLIKLLINKYETQTKFASFAFVIAAPAIVIRKCIFDNPNFYFTIPQIITGIIFGLVSFALMFFIPILYRKYTKDNVITGKESVLIEGDLNNIK